MESITRESCDYMADEQFAALPRMQNALGPFIIKTLAALPVEEQLAMINRYIDSERALTDQGFREGINNRPPIEIQPPQVNVNVPAPEIHMQPPPPRTEDSRLKLEVSLYHGKEEENLNRWFTEIIIAMDVQKIHAAKQQLAFAMSKLRGRARDWAYGCIMKDVRRFMDFDTLREAMIQTFQPPKCEFRIRQQLLTVRQGNKSLHDFTQRIRYLSTSLTSTPMDEDTLVSIFLQGLKDGPVRTQLFRSYPKSLEDAISEALQEEFSRTQAMRNGSSHAMPRASRDPMAMDLSNIQGTAQRKDFDKSKIQCYRCNKFGHMIKDCRVKMPFNGNNHSQKKNWNRSNSSFKPKNSSNQ